MSALTLYTNTHTHILAWYITHVASTNLAINLCSSCCCLAICLLFSSHFIYRWIFYLQFSNFYATLSKTEPSYTRYVHRVFVLVSLCAFFSFSFSFLTLALWIVAVSHICCITYSILTFSIRKPLPQTRWMMMIEEGRTKPNETIYLYKDSFSLVSRLNSLTAMKILWTKKSVKCFSTSR